VSVARWSRPSATLMLCLTESSPPGVLVNACWMDRDNTANVLAFFHTFLITIVSLTVNT
jgi:hypothetical protein